MCFALFIGTESVLPVERTADAEDRFHLEELMPHHEVVLGHFSKPHVYYASSWQGCGCGWHADSIALLSGYTPSKQKKLTAQCLIELRTLLGDLLGREESVEMFMGWEDDLDEGVLRNLRLSLDDLDGPSLPLEQGDFASVSAIATT